MAKLEEFQTKQRVRIFDDYEHKIIYGKVKEVKEKSVIIEWDDMVSDVEHFEDEYKTIRILEQQ